MEGAISRQTLVKVSQKGGRAGEEASWAGGH